MITIANLPPILSVWKHRNGINYVVISITNNGSTNENYPLTIVYENAVTGSLWSRPFSTWHNSFTRLDD